MRKLSSTEGTVDHLADRLWDIHDVSEYLRVPVGTLYRWRRTNDGPPAFRYGRHLRWTKTTVDRWLASRLEADNAQPRRRRSA